MNDGWIIGLGEVLWDIFQDGPVFGGAPANFACHARALGCQVAMVSAIGPDSDPLAQPALDALAQHGVDIRAVQRNHSETGRVLVEVDPQGQPTYAFSLHPAWDQIEWTEQLAELAAQSRAVCFGTLAQRAVLSRQTILRFLQAVPRDCLRIFDVNLRVNFWTEQTIVDSIGHCDLLKLNEHELPIVLEACRVCRADQLPCEPSGWIEPLRKLQSQFNLSLIALTCGAQGATLLTPDQLDHCVPPPVVLRDTVGAGDAYTAAIMLGWLKKWSLSEINRRATSVAGYVCSQKGATPNLPPEIVSLFAD